MISDIEFCEKYIGSHWTSRGESEKGCDCWGLVLASYREIDGLELPQVPGYAEGDGNATEEVADNALALGVFTPSQPCNGAIMASFNTKGQIYHVGRCLHGRVLHATRRMGVRWDTYRAINNASSDVRYFMYKPEQS